MKNKVIAIDGPAASGKSTVARRVASELGYLYVDSGALYRGVTWKALREKINAEDAGWLAGLVADIDIEFFIKGDAMYFRIDGVELGAELRTEAVNENVSQVSAVPEVRSQVHTWLRDMIRFGDLVMEGRDIGTVVFPEAEFKFYLDASPQERARRRHAEMGEAQNSVVSVEKVREGLERRDAIDSNRGNDPLAIAPEAVVIDSTSMSIEEVVQAIIGKIA